MTEQYRVLDVIPHDQPMSLLDNIENYSNTGLTASVTPTRESVLADEKGVPSWVGIEYMGQAIAAYAGVGARQRQEPVKIGFLVSTRRYEPNCSHFPFGEKLEVSVERITDNETGLRVFDCVIQSSHVFVQANLNVFMPENIDEFLQENS